MTGRMSRGPSFDAAFVALSALVVLGLYVDGWAHYHLASALETFFTPWHALFYGAFALLAAFLAVTAWRNHAEGEPWRESLPRGYWPSLVAVVAFVVAGALDLLWHQFVGVERDIATHLSPTHLLLAAALVVIIAGPLRAAMAADEPPRSFAKTLPALLSMTLLLCVAALFLENVHSFYIPWASGLRLPNPTLPGPIHADFVALEEALGIASVIVQTALFMGLALVALRHGLLPVGSITLMLGVSTLLLNASLAPAAVAGGIVADVLLAWLRPSATRTRQLRVFALAAPVALYAFYFAELAIAKRGVWWPVHLWVGAIVLAALTGLATSYALVPYASAFASTESERS